MDRKRIKFCSCRLTTHHETGRVRWCMGADERKWQIKLKRLVFLPIFLLPVVIFVILFTKYFSPTHDNIEKAVVPLNTPYKFEEKPPMMMMMAAKIPNKRNLLYFDNYSQTNNESDVVVVDDDDHDDSLTEPLSFWKINLNYTEIRSLQALTMKKYMNDSVDPCENFYEYACGNWKIYHNIPPDRTSYDTFEILREKLDYVLRDLLSNITKFDKDYPETATAKAKLFYQSCMNEEKLSSRGYRPLKTLLKSLGNWPVITKNWNQSNFNLESLMGELKNYNNDALLAEWVGPDIDDSNTYIIQIEQPSLGLPGRNYYVDPSYSKYLDAYKELIISIAVILNASSSSTISIENIKEDVDNIIKFETDLANVQG